MHRQPQLCRLGAAVLAVMAQIAGCSRHTVPTKEPGDQAMLAAALEPVILIPGVTGSELLRDHDTRVWPPRLLSVRDDFKALHCGKDGQSLLPLIVGEPIDDFYGALGTMLTARGHKVYRFGYDWRLDNTVLGGHLDSLISKIKDPRVTIIAHSMGGLLSTSYVHRQGAKRIKHLITLGTPFLGTPGTIKTLDKGDYLNGVIGYFLRPHFIKTFENSASWYQLLPSREFFALQSHYVRKVYSSGETIEIKGYKATEDFIRSRPWANPSMLEAKERFHNEIDLVGTLRQVDSYFIIGEGQATVGGVDFKFKHAGSGEEFVGWEPVSANGDGAVVLPSANIGGRTELIHPGHTYYIDEGHAGLMTNSVVFSQLASILDGSPKPVDGIRLRPKNLAPADLR